MWYDSFICVQHTHCHVYAIHTWFLCNNTWYASEMIPYVSPRIDMYMYISIYSEENQSVRDPFRQKSLFCHVFWICHFKHMEVFCDTSSYNARGWRHVAWHMHDPNRIVHVFSKAYFDVVTDSTEIVILPRSTTSKNTDSLVSRNTNSNSNFCRIWICTQEFGLCDLVVFGSVAFSMEFVIYTHARPEYRVAKTHRMAYLHRSFSAKEPYN